MVRRSLVVVLVLSLLVPLSLPTVSAQELSPILVYAGNDALNYDYSQFGQAAGRTVETQFSLPADLSSYGCVILPINEEAFSEGQLEQLATYVRSGGRLLALGEWATESSGFPLANANMNALASELGSGLSLENVSIDYLLNVTTNIEPSVFTQGVSSIGYVTATQVGVSGAGQLLVRTQGESGVPLVGAEQIGAGLFVVSGDSNVFSDNSFNAFTAGDNGKLVYNLCSKPLTPPILVYTGNDAYISGYTQFGQAAGRTVETQFSLPDDLSVYGCVILPLNGTPFSSTQLEQFAGYVQGGGRLFALGEFQEFLPDVNGNMNVVAAEVGSGLSIIEDLIAPGVQATTNIEPSHFTQGVSSLSLAGTSRISATGNGQVLARTAGSDGVPFIGAEQIGAGLFVLSGDTNVFSDVTSPFSAEHDNGRLAFNLCSGNLPPTVTVDGVTEGASYEFGAVPVATCLVEDDEDGPSSFPATLSAITGPQAALGLGSQTASCSYTDDGGLTTSASVTYTIVDTTAPELDLSDLVVPATSPSGATVEWTATAEDAVDGSIEAGCTPPSGSFFSIPDPRSDSTTTVQCSVTDTSGNMSTDSFTVTVLGGASQLSVLRNDVQQSDISSVAIRGLDRALASAETGLNRNHLPTTCFQLNYFQTQVNLYRMMGQISAEQAADWLADAARIKTVLGC